LFLCSFFFFVLGQNEHRKKTNKTKQTPNTPKNKTKKTKDKSVKTEQNRTTIAIQ